MRYPWLVCLLMLGPGTLSCGDSDPITPALLGTLEVYVYYQDAGLEDKELELLELGLDRTTNASGLAYFTLPPGEYTLRAYDINMGGPCCAYVDREVTIRIADTTRVEIFDCVTCD